MPRCCEYMSKHITCHNGCFDLVLEDGLCAKCIDAALRDRVDAAERAAGWDKNP